MTLENQEGDTPAYGYLSLAGIPAGLLLALGSWYVLKSVGDYDVYQREAPGMLLALQWLQWLGIGVALAAFFALLLNLRKRT